MTLLAATRSSFIEEMTRASMAAAMVEVNLRGRETLEIELPAFLVRALEERVREANEGASIDDAVTLNHLIEVELADAVTLADVAHMEAAMPGIGAEISRWISEID